MQEIIINKNEAGQRFDKYLQKYFKAAGSGFIYKMLRKKNIELNGKKSDGKEKLQIGDSVKIFMTDDTIAKFRGNVQTQSKNDKNKATKTDIDIIKNNIVYEDDNIILVNKPAGVLSQKSKPDDYSLNEMIINYLIVEGKLTTEELETFKPSVCNRLDRNTSGLISFGKSLKGIQELSLGFKERFFDKYYIAVVWGNIKASQAIEGYLVKNEKTNKVKISDRYDSNSNEKSSYIKTYYEPLKHAKIFIDGKPSDISLLKIKLITGKTHQIRAHLASIGHSILGDDKYGNKTKNQYLKKHYKINWQLLHSYELIINSNESYEVLKDLEGEHFVAEPDIIYEKFFKSSACNT